MAARICELIAVLLIWIAAEIFPSAEAEQLLYQNFRCNNGKYIKNSYFCDGDHNDCDDSDESFGCSREHCGPGKFTCSSDSVCLDITRRCNTIYDCADHSDELNCVGDETNIKDCSLYKGKFLCTDKLKCLDYNYTCDGICHCFDCSDENGHCNETDTNSCRPCLNFCLPTPIGPQCPCNLANYKSTEFCKNISQEIEDCTGLQHCEQSCSVYRHRTRCLCFEDFHEVPGSRNPHPKCRSNEWLGSALLYSSVSKIKSLNLTYPKEARTIQRGFNHASSIFVLTGANNYAYYTSFYHKRLCIFKTSINNGETNLIIQSSSSITSLSVDWITENIYFTSNGSLSVCTNDGKVCAQLECCDDADNVALVPDFGQMYFSKKSIFKNERNIMKSNMDGSEKDFLVDANFVHPISLAINQEKKTLYLYELSTNLLYSILLLESNKEVSMQLQFRKYDFISVVGRSFSSFAAFDNRLLIPKLNATCIRYRNFIQTWKQTL
ncbi:vitellogenin receptor Yl-like isoform X2 [Planococcus citri]|uniref:vitellogenin receptor Yl-like isoform X2 n=1 Tax=Planococcus citri TaxID=170843 RepID=UPI0031F977F0